MWHNSIINFILQRYQGFNIINSNSENLGFREDIVNFTADVGYSYALNGKKMSLGAIFSGSQMQKKSIGSFFLGGFIMYYDIQSDSSMIPSSEDENYIDAYGLTRSQNFGIGLNFGYGYVFVLPKDFFIFTAFNPGVGVLYKDVSGQNSNYKDDNPLVLQFNFRLSGGYSGPRYYFTLNFNDNITYTTFASDYSSSLNISKIKLAFGYKFNKK